MTRDPIEAAVALAEKYIGDERDASDLKLKHASECCVDAHRASLLRDAASHLAAASTLAEFRIALLGLR